MIISVIFNHIQLFGALKHYSPHITLDAVGLFNSKGICVDLVDSDSGKVVVQDFKAVYPDFGRLYKHYYEKYVAK